jgi:hypothetical protein
MGTRSIMTDSTTNPNTDNTITITPPDMGTTNIPWFQPLPHPGGGCPECGYCRTCGRYVGPVSSPYPGYTYPILTWQDGSKMTLC